MTGDISSTQHWVRRIHDKQLPNGHDVTVLNNGFAADLGLIDGIQNISITGNTLGGIDSGVQCDIWPGADSGLLVGGGIKTWVKPTAARIHSIVSNSIDDAAAGTGVRTVVVRGLTSWTADEVIESITMNGLTPVNTVNSYVCLNDITATTCGSNGTNVGHVTATAAVDATVQLAMRAGDGRSQRAIYAYPSTKRIVFKRWGAFLNQATGSGDYVEFRIVVDLTPSATNRNWIVADQRTAVSNGNSAPHWPIDPPPSVAGPAIIKVQGIGSRNNLSGGASFGFYLVDV